MFNAIRILLFVLALSFGLSVSSISAQEALPACFGPLLYGYTLIEDPETYRSTWRDVRALRPEDGPPWAEGFFTVSGDASSDGGQLHMFHPTRFTFSGVINAMYRRIGPDAGPAIELLLDQAMIDGVVLGPTEDVPHAQALDIFDRAGRVCLGE